MNNLSPQDLIHKNENKYYYIVLSISIISYIFLILSVYGILILIGLMLISSSLNSRMIGNVRANGVKISERQFPEVYKKVEQLCEKMDINKVPDIYVIQSEGMLNAFATRFFKRNMVVIYSEIFELVITGHDDELNFVLAHELAHIKRNHLAKQLFILPAMWLPGIAELYLRACEYTCDRIAAYTVGNSEAAKNSLMMLAIGKQLYLHVDKEEYMKQLNDENSFIAWLSEIYSSHPPLPKRINEIGKLFGEQTEGLTQLNPMKKRWIVGLISMSVCSIAILSVGIYFVMNEFNQSEYEYYDEEEYVELEISAFHIAIGNGDLSSVLQFINDGEDIYQEDYYGNTSIDWAIKSGNVDMLELLLESGADLNYENSYGMTALMTAAEIADLIMVEQLIERGADPNYQTDSGMMALHYAIYSSNLEIVQQLLDMGANPNLKDVDNMNAYLVAIESGEREIAELLKKYIN